MKRTYELLLVFLLSFFVAGITHAQAALGWSDDGRIVAVADYRLGHLGDWVVLSLWIQDVVTDEILFSDGMSWSSPLMETDATEPSPDESDSEPFPTSYDDAYALYTEETTDQGRSGIEGAMDDYGVVREPEPVLARQFPLYIGGDVYRVLARRYDVVQEGEPYPLIVESRELGRKAITDLSDNEHYVLPLEAYPQFYEVNGYLLNPDRTRMLVVIQVQNRDFPVEWFPYSYGCALYLGFDPDAYRSDDIVPSGWTGGH